MDLNTLSTQTPQEPVVLNSTPLPSKMLQEAEKAENSKFPPKLFIMTGVAVLVLFGLSLAGFVLTQPKDDATAAPPVVIKKESGGTENNGSVVPSTAPNSNDPIINELNSIDTSSVGAELDSIASDAAQL